MAYTERYVSVAGGGLHDGTTPDDAWTFAEYIAAAPGAGTRANMKAGSYTSGAVTLLAGSAAALNVLRGYNSTIGDLDNQGRNADGTLNVTNFPVLTITAACTPASYSLWQNISVTGAISATLITSTTIDRQYFLSCKFVNTQNNASARCVAADDACYVTNCDFDCTGAAHGIVAAFSNLSVISGCRFHGTDTDVLLSLNVSPVTVINCLFYGNSSSIGIDCGNTGGGSFIISGCTFQGIGTAIQLPDSLNVGAIIAINNICTDCSAWIYSQYNVTATVALIECNNRTRDVTTLLTGMESTSIGAVTTDTGGPETDYVDAAAGDYRLISSSPATEAGLPALASAGAYQRGQRQVSSTFTG